VDLGPEHQSQVFIGRSEFAEMFTGSRKVQEFELPFWVGQAWTQ
jgi:hypothetical protein